MQRRASVIVLKDNLVLLVKLKEQDKLLPRATWVFPFLNITDDSSPRKEINDFLSYMRINYKLTDQVFKYAPSENPKLTYFVYVADYVKGEPEISRFFQSYKWVPIKDIVAYSTSFMDDHVSKYLNEIAEKTEKFKDL